jgi:carbamate kinase
VKRIVIAVGGNALLERAEVPSAEIQEQHVRAAVEGLAGVLADHEVVITHGNGPQVGILAMEAARDPSLARPFPFDVLGAQTQGMIGYFFLQALESACPRRDVVSMVTQVLVSSDDPAFDEPTKFVGPMLEASDASKLEERWGWAIRADGDGMRRVVASPEPIEVLEIASIERLVSARSIVVCAGGGGIPVVRLEDGSIRGVEAVIDKDLTAAHLAARLGADGLVILTDVPAVEDDFGTSRARPIRSATSSELRRGSFPAGSMGPKVEAACRFVEATGARAMIGRLDDVESVLAGLSGTTVIPDGPGPTA